MIYKGLERYLEEHKTTKSNLADECQISRTCMYNICKGKALPTKYTIDRILEITGLTYEECFREV